MLVARDLVAEQRERAVERLVVPLAGIDQDAVHVEDDGLDLGVHANTSWALVGWSVQRKTSGRVQTGHARHRCQVRSRSRPCSSGETTATRLPAERCAAIRCSAM